MQVRQVLSVYVDNRCRCGSDRHQMGMGADAQAQHRPQSFPVGAGIYGACAELGTGLYATVPPPQQQQQHHHVVEPQGGGGGQCCYCLAQLHSGLAARNHYAQITGRYCDVIDDNAINQSIYMSAKEARIQQQQQQQMLYAKNQSLIVIAGGGNHPPPRPRDCAARVAAPAKDVVVVPPLEMPPQREDAAQIGAAPSEGGTGQHQRHQRQEAPEVPIGAELPASFDSVTLKRMLRSLSSSPPLDRSSSVELPTTGADSKQQGTSNELPRNHLGGGGSGTQEDVDPPLRLNSSSSASVKREKSPESVGFNQLQTRRPDAADKKNSGEIPAKNVEVKRDQSSSGAPPVDSNAAAPQGRSLPNGCSSRSAIGKETCKEPSDAGQSEFETARVNAEAKSAVYGGRNGTEHTSKIGQGEDSYKTFYVEKPALNCLKQLSTGLSPPCKRLINYLPTS